MMNQISRSWHYYITTGRKLFDRTFGTVIFLKTNNEFLSFVLSLSYVIGAILLILVIGLLPQVVTDKGTIMKPVYTIRLF